MRVGRRSLNGVTWVAALGLLMGRAAPGVEGQVFAPDPVEHAALALQLERPLIPGIEGLAIYSAVLDVDLLLPLGSGPTLQIGAPLAVAGADVADGTSVYLGNLRASLLFGEPDLPRGYLGVTLPTADALTRENYALVLGVLPSLDEREKWAESFAVRGAFTPSSELEGGGLLGFDLGAAAVAPTDLENLFVFARVGAWGRFPVGSAELRTELETSYEVTNDDGFGRQFTAYLDLGATLTESSGRPGVFIRVPLDGDAREALDLSIGLRAVF